MHCSGTVGSLSLLILLAGCDQSQTAPKQARMLMSDDAPSSFVLTAKERSRLVPNINVDALQRFLQIAAASSEERAALLQMFSTQPGQNTSFQLVGATHVDPQLKSLLDEIWAPTWEAWGPDAIARSESKLPGREIAKARLAAKKPSSSKE